MTAIVSTYVPEQGFLVGADSRRRNANTGEIVDSARKIFSIEGNGTQLAYAWAGNTYLIQASGQEFSFLDETASIGNALAMIKPPSIDEFVQQFARQMYRRLQSLCLSDGRLLSNPNLFTREDIAHVLIVGYYNGKPYRTGVKFSQKKSVLQPPFMDDLFESPDEFGIFSGSAAVYNDQQPLVAPETLQEAVELVRKYIQACIDNRNNYADCASFGGQVQVATVTQEQFKWAIAPPEAAGA